MKNKEQKMIQLDKALDEIFDEMKSVFQKLVFKTMIYRDIHFEVVGDKLEKSFDKLSPGLKEQLNDKSN